MDTAVISQASARFVVQEKGSLSTLLVGFIYLESSNDRGLWPSLVQVFNVFDAAKLGLPKLGSKPDIVDELPPYGDWVAEPTAA